MPDLSRVDQREPRGSCEAYQTPTADRAPLPSPLPSSTAVAPPTDSARWQASDNPKHMPPVVRAAGRPRHQTRLTDGSRPRAAGRFRFGCGCNGTVSCRSTVRKELDPGLALGRRQTPACDRSCRLVYSPWSPPNTLSMRTIVHTDNPGRPWIRRRTQHQRRYTGDRPAAYPSSTRPRRPVLPY